MTGFRLLSEIRNIEVIAVGRAIRDLPKLKKAYGKGRWRKLKGRALVELDTGEVVEAELHWYEAHGIGRQDMLVRQHRGSGAENLAAVRSRLADRLRRPLPWSAVRLHVPDRRARSWRASRHADGGRAASDGDDVHLGTGGREPDADDASKPRRAERLSKMVAPFMAAATHRANRKDLARLKALLERA